MTSRHIRLATEGCKVADCVAHLCRRVIVENANIDTDSWCSWEVRSFSSELVAIASGLSMRTIGLSVGSDASDSVISDYLYWSKHE